MPEMRTAAILLHDIDDALAVCGMLPALLKIDRSLVGNLPKDSEDQLIAQSIISMGKALGNDRKEELRTIFSSLWKQAGR
jgi:hypothetical protein